ncbi:sugar transporter [Wielerella bovis]|uniref:sugar transporter n=1 Tax=Wielerella bovis TaxID=2917790 RepID=UPI002018533F|nr:sugar transporter [Wielerella bovis]ULJ68561.1 sugar transporter [Wielerella bovis]
MNKKQALHFPYYRVIALALAAFIFNTTEFIPIALLSDIGASFNMPVSEVGIIMTAYAWLVTLMSLPFMLLTAKMERRKLLLILFTVFIIGHALSVLAWNFTTLLLSRMFIALAHAVFWSIMSSLTMRVAPRGKKQQALGWMSMGTAMAAVLGLPLGRLIGQYFGWRITLAFIGILAACVMIVLMKLLPKLESKNAGSLKSLPLLVKRPLLLGVYALTALTITAHFTAYSYIEPYVLNITKMSANAATTVLLMFGLSGFVASSLFGRFYPRMPDKFLKIAASILIFALATLHLFGTHPVTMYGLIFMWGIGISCLSLAMTARVLSYAPDATDVAASIFSGIYNIGIGGGALIGGMVMRNAQLGLGAIGWVGALLGALALSIFIIISIKYRHTAPNDDTPQSLHIAH